MKIVIIGAGAMGCLYGAYLSRHNEVIMLDSYQPQVDAINKNGITVSEEDGTERIQVDPAKCIGCGACMDACKHGAREFEDDTEQFFADLAKVRNIHTISSGVQGKLS